MTVGFRRIHPYTFSIIYTSISILALTENDVLNSMVVGLAICQAHAVGMLYMQIVWYWAGRNEKLTHGKPSIDYDHNGDPIILTTTHAAELYTTKEMQYALYLAMVSIALLSLFQTVGPYDYNTGDIWLRGAPPLFTVISVFGTLYLQSLNLDDEYGMEKPKVPDGLNPRQMLVWSATRITQGKLGVSLLLLAFGAAYEFNLVGEYFRGLRAYQDKLPERAWQFDTANRFTIGTGFLPAPALYL